MLRRHSIDGFWDRSQSHGEVTGYGSGFQEAMKKFNERQARLGEVGKWRHGSAMWKRKSKGTYIDRDWAIIDF